MKLNSAVYFLLGLAAALTVLNIDASAIATAFSANITGEPPISDYVTFVPGNNVTLSQTGHNITINANAATGGTTDHSNLTNLNWADSGHTIDGPVEMEQNAINNASVVRIGGSTPYAVSGEKLIINNEATGAYVRLETNNVQGNVFFGARYRGTLATTVTALQNNDILFRLGGVGTKADDTYSGVTAEIRMQTNAVWTSTSTPAVISFLTVKNSSTAQILRWQINDSGYLLPAANKTYDIGSPSLRVRNIYTETQVIGDINEEYTYNHSFTYNIGDVVELDMGKDEVTLASAGSTRIVGVITKLPYQETFDDNGTAVTLNYDVLTVAILGKVGSVKSTGTINKGDTLISAGGGYATSMHDKSFLTDYMPVPARSRDPAKYNTYLVPGQKIGLALQSSDKDGFIPAIIGKG